MNSQWSDLDGQALGDAFYGKFRRAIAIWLQRNGLTASWLERIEVVAETREIARAVVEHELNDGDDARSERLFTSAMTVQYASPVVAKIWRRCNSAVSN
jgi:hypothetical protein